MATYYSNAFRADGAAKSVKYQEKGVYSVTGVFTATTALVLNDVIRMCPVPAGVRVKDVILGTGDLDTGTTIVLDVGDTMGTDDTDRYIDGSTIGRTGGVDRMNNVAGVNFLTPEEGTIDVLVQAAPTGGGTGTVTLTVLLAADDAP